MGAPNLFLAPGAILLRYAPAGMRSQLKNKALRIPPWVLLSYFEILTAIVRLERFRF